MKSSIIITLIAFIVTTFSYSEAKGNYKTKIKQNGVAEIGLRYDDKGMRLGNSGSWIKSNEFSRIGNIEVDLKFIPFKNNYLAFDVEYELGLPTVNIEKLYLAFLLKKRNIIKIGYMKKKFGLESIIGKSDRKTIDKSAVYEYVKSFNIYGEDLMLQYQWKKKFNNKLKSIKFWSAIGGDASKKYFFVLGNSLAVRPGTICASLMYINSESLTDDEEYLLASLAFQQKYKFLSTDLELIGGNDPSASEIEELLGDDRTVVFLGGRIQQAYSIPFNFKVIPEIVPLWEANIIIKDLETDKRSFQFSPGLNVYLGKKKISQLMLGVDLRYSSHAPNHEEMSRNQISYIGEFKFQW